MHPEAPIETLYGNTQGLKPSASKALQALARRRVAAEAWLSPELARRLTELSRELGRQLGVTIDRRGRVAHVIVGDAHRLFIPDLGRHRAGSDRFRGLRLVHTHLRGEGLSQDDLTDLSLLRLDAVLVVEARLDGLPGFVEIGTLDPEPPQAQAAGATPWHIERRTSVHGWEQDFARFIQELEAQFSRRDALRRVPGAEGCVLIGVTIDNARAAEASLAELARLADTAGLQVLDQVLQVRRKFDGRTVMGKGKLREVLVRAMQLGADVLAFDRELTPSQLRNIATATDLKVIDRTQLILDIFALRAQTREGKLQVELAQLRYRKPRLAAMPTAMSRLAGGIGGRGPGESKLELNRRRAGERQSQLEKQLRKLSKQRALRRRRRQRVGLPQVAIVGYTNAGKSTLLNAMTNAHVDAEDKLFATLDPTSRRLRFPEERALILTDTVGFIRDLPDDLVHAFRATLEEAIEADLLLHVIDASNPECDRHIAEVERTLGTIGASAPQLRVLNKIDACDPLDWSALATRHDALLVSAQAGEGLGALLDQVERRLFHRRASEPAAAVAPPTRAAQS